MFYYLLVGNTHEYIPIGTCILLLNRRAWSGSFLLPGEMAAKVMVQIYQVSINPFIGALLWSEVNRFLYYSLPVVFTGTGE